MATEIRPPEPPPQKMAERIADQLRTQIIRRELVDGEYLPFEADLCAHFATSRPTMREAFRILEAEGLLRIRRGGRHGPQVQAPDAAVLARQLGLLLQYQSVDLAEVYDAFLAIVPDAARRLAAVADAEDIGALRAQRARCAAASDDGAAFLEESTAFLLLVVERAGNPVQSLVTGILAEVLRAHRDAMSAYLVARPRVRARRASEVLASTATIIAMIEAGDASVGEVLHDALGSHVRQALRVPVLGAVQLV
jgi:DNA-binding FadR family transcriptional regulator